jgi:hypothetical protein
LVDRRETALKETTASLFHAIARALSMADRVRWPWIGIAAAEQSLQVETAIVGGVQDHGPTMLFSWHACSILLLSVLQLSMLKRILYPNSTSCFSYQVSTFASFLSGCSLDCEACGHSLLESFAALLNIRYWLTPFASYLIINRQTTFLLLHSNTSIHR